MHSMSLRVLNAQLLIPNSAPNKWGQKETKNNSVILVNEKNSRERLNTPTHTEKMCKSMEKCVHVQKPNVVIMQLKYKQFMMKCTLVIEVAVKFDFFFL